MTSCDFGAEELESLCKIATQMNFVFN